MHADQCWPAGKANMDLTIVCGFISLFSALPQPTAKGRPHQVSNLPQLHPKCLVLVYDYQRHVAKNVKKAVHCNRRNFLLPMKPFVGI